MSDPSRHITQLIIDLNAIRHNVGLIRTHVGPHVQVMAVVKANAYGHGMVPVAQTALASGATWLGVSSLAEAVTLREANITAPILAMGYTPATLAEEAIYHDVSVNLYDLGVAQAFSKAAVARQQPCRVHIKVDTGMGRLGVLPGDAGAVIDAIATLPGVVVEGLFTHLSCAESDPDYSHEQLRRFGGVARRQHMLWLHACNSAGTCAYPEGHFNLVRPGLALYGMSPFNVGQTPSAFQGLQPALRWVTRVGSVKTLPDGAPVGYNARYHCEDERRIAVIPVGYGDGFRRTPKNAGEVLVRGKRAPICGSVCMDQTMIDVTHIPNVHIDDEVVLIGVQGNERITAEDVAERIGTVNYEVTTTLLARPARVYVGD
jgi:alanine racemase